MLSVQPIVSFLLFRPMLFHAHQRLLLYVVLLFMSESTGSEHAFPPINAILLELFICLFFV